MDRALAGLEHKFFAEIEENLIKQIVKAPKASG
jgi:hypothetical protein